MYLNCLVPSSTLVEEFTPLGETPKYNYAFRMLFVVKITLLNLGVHPGEKDKLRCTHVSNGKLSSVTAYKFPVLFWKQSIKRDN